MVTKKITLNELRTIVKQIIKEEKNKKKINLNESKLKGAMFDDYDFRYNGDVLSELIINYNFKPSTELVKKDLKLIKNNFKEGSIYNTFQPKLGVIYSFVYGWNSGYNVYLTTNENSKYEDNPFFDEPTLKYQKNRKVFRF